MADEERAGREDATAAVMKMQNIITSVRDDMVEAQLASDQCVPAISWACRVVMPYKCISMSCMCDGEPFAVSGLHRPIDHPSFCSRKPLCCLCSTGALVVLQHFT